MATIGWNESYVTSGSNASAGDDAFRSFVTAVAIGLGTAMYWPGSSGNTGASGDSVGTPVLGTARPMQAAYATLNSGTGAHGYLGLDPKHAALYHLRAPAAPTTATGIVGHSGMLDYGGGIGNAPFTVRWVMETGSFTTTAAGAIAFSSAYNGQPVVILVSDTPHVQGGLSAVTTGGFTYTYDELGGTSGMTVTWRSEGTKTI